MSDGDGAQIDKAMALLAQHGFRLSVGGCGCCGSPDVRLEFNGELVIHDEGAPREYVNFDMFPETDHMLRFRVVDANRRAESPVDPNVLATACGYDLDALAKRLDLHRRRGIPNEALR